MDRAHKPSAIQPGTPSSTISVTAQKDRVSAQLPTGESVAVLLHGATVLSWKSDGGKRENLWLSTETKLDGSKPVRGGIPLVFPVFGPPPKEGHATSQLAQHGFARNVRWEFLGKNVSEGESNDLGNDTVKLDFGLYPSAVPEETRAKWPYGFGLVYSVTLGAKGLQTSLNVQNTGTEAFEFKALLHTYLAVRDIGKTLVTGLAAETYVDRVNGGASVQQAKPELSVQGEVDSLYTGVKQNTVSLVEDGKPSLDIERDNMADIVVWNPWKERAAAMGDFAPKDGYLHMLCVEAGAVESWIKLENGESWEGGQVLRSH